MISFAPVRTPRLTADLRELTIGAAEYLCSLPPNMHERNTTEFLKRAVTENARPLPGQVEDPRKWTVNERGAVVAHYLMHMSETDPDFEIGAGHYSDYALGGERRHQEVIELGEVGGANWTMKPLLGLEAEAIERLAVQGESNRLLWWTGAMAFQLHQAGDAMPTDESDAALDAYLAQRFMYFREINEREFAGLVMAFLEGQDKLDCHLRLGFDDDGIVFMPAREKEGPGLPPARFPVRSLVSEPTRRILGVVDDPEE